jgi:hypothetical protein
LGNLWRIPTRCSGVNASSKTEAEPIPVLFAKKLARNLKKTRFPNNHLVDEGVGHLIGYMLIAVVLENVVVDEVTKILQCLS